MKRRVGSLACLVLLAASGCGSRGGLLPSAAPALQSEAHASAARPSRDGTVRITVKVPLRERRRSNYVSPATRSISIAIFNAARTKQVASVHTDLAPGATQTMSVTLAPATYSFDATAYDADRETGNVLSKETGFPFSVRSGAINSVP